MPANSSDAPICTLRATMKRAANINSCGLLCCLTNMKAEVSLGNVRIDRNHTPDHLVGSRFEFRQRNDQERGIRAIEMRIPFVDFLAG